MTVSLGFEVEFYLRAALEPDVMQQVSNQLKPAKLVKERGFLQYELVTEPYQFTTVEDIIIRYNDILSKMRALLHDVDPLLQCDFDPKPFEDDYGSALQISVSVDGFEKQQYLNFIYCLLHNSADFHLVINKKSGAVRMQQGFMAPTHIAWGGNNNRTTLVRAINLDQSDMSKVRIEYRLANSNADVDVLVGFVIDCMQQSIVRTFPKFEKIWGNAYDSQYEGHPIIC